MAVGLAVAALAVTGSATPRSGLDGANETFAFTVTNKGAVSATNTMLTIPLPSSGAQLVSASSICSGTMTLRCSLGTIPRSGSSTVAVVLRPIQPGPLSLKATGSTDSPQTDTSHDSATATATIASATNLTIVGFDGPPTAVVGDQLQYTLRLVNTGPERMPNARVAVSAPPGRLAVIYEGAADQGSCMQTIPFTCKLGAIASGETVTVGFTVWARGAGTYTFRASTAGDLPDTDTADNSASLSTTAVAVAAPASVLSNLRVSPRAFPTTGPHGGARIAFELNEAGPVHLQVWGPLRRSCHGARSRRACRQVTPFRGAFTDDGSLGDNLVPFHGILRGSPLSPGRYRLTVWPNNGDSSSTTFFVTG